jgi:predicted O-linked N-acetylglucosamine transferase (SPINDLY family)
LTTPDTPSRTGIEYAEKAESLFDAGRLRESIALYYRALELCPDAAAIWHGLGNAVLSLGLADEAIRFFSRANQIDPSFAAVQSNLLHALLYSPTLSPYEISEAHRRWGSRFEAPPVQRSRQAGERIRIGYVSSNFRSDPEAFFVEPILRNHDRSRFEVFGYSSVSRTDDLTVRLEGLCEHWLDIAQISDDNAAEFIRGDGIDILVDCSGHQGEGRTRLFARRPAAVQVSLPIYPATTGLSTVDYRITDGHADPLGLTERLYTETLIRLPCYACYQAPDDAPDVGVLPAKRRGFITFGAFHRFQKLSPPLLDSWAAILARIPGSRLHFHQSFGGFHDAPRDYRESIVNRLAALGTDPARLCFSGKRSHLGHLDLFNEIDISLDSFPYNGMTTTCESLWMGVPVVSLAGNSHVSRTGASLLRAVGLDEWVSETLEGYQRIAVEKSSDLSALETLRSGLRERMQRSVLTDGVRYTRSLEDAYLSMLQGRTSTKR